MNTQIQQGFFNIMITVELEPTTRGTHLQWNIKLKGALPRWIRRRFCRRLAVHNCNLKDNFSLMAQMMEEAGRTVGGSSSELETTVISLG